MNKTRKAFAVILACAVMLLMTACGEVAFEHGSWNGQTYTSEYFGFTVKGDANWKVVTDDGLAKLNDINDMSPDNIKSVLNKGGLMEMKLSKSQGGGITIFVYDNEKRPDYREFQYIDARLKAVEDKYGSLKTINCIAKKSTIDFLGVLTVCVETETNLRGLGTSYGYEIPVVKGNYTASIVISSMNKSDLDMLAKRFSAL